MDFKEKAKIANMIYMSVKDLAREEQFYILGIARGLKTLQVKKEEKEITAETA